MFFLEDKHRGKICFFFAGGRIETNHRPLGNILDIGSYEIQSHLVLQMSASDQRTTKGAATAA